MIRSGRSAGDPDGRILRRSCVVGAVTSAVFLLAVCNWQPWTLLARGGFSSDFYDAQAHAFLRLRLDVPPEVAGIEGFVVGDSTYLYYGPLLALARLPFAVFGHWADGHLVRLSLVLGFIVLCVAAYRLAIEARRALTALRPGRDASADDRRVPLFVGAVGCSPAFALIGWISVYHETELWAAVFVVLAAVATLALHRAPARQPLILASVFVVAAVLTRASVGIGAAIGLGLVGLMLWRRARSTSMWCVAVAVVAPLLHGLVNQAKFGSLFGLPAERQVLTQLDPERAAWFAGNDGSFFGLRFLGTTVLHYLRPDTVRFERLIPIVRFGPSADDIGSYPLESNTPSSSLTAAATLLLVLAVVGLVLIVRRRAWSWLAVAVGTTCGAVPTFLIGFIANRYLVDLLPMLMVPAAFGTLAAPLPASRWSRRVVGAAAAALVVWGLGVNLALGVWLQQLREPGFTEVRYRVDDAIFGGRSPGIVALGVTAGVPRNGIVGLDEACRGVYVAADGRWVALERDRTRRAVGTFGPAGGTSVFVTPTHALDLVPGDGTLRAELRTPEASVSGEPLEWDGRPVTVRIISDPVTAEFDVTVDGRFAVRQLGAIALDDATFGPGWSAQPAGTPLCAQLSEAVGR